VEFKIGYHLPQDLAAALESAVAQRRNERELEHSLHNLTDLVEARSGRSARTAGPRSRGGSMAREQAERDAEAAASQSGSGSSSGSDSDDD
jgi:hypothetical protein